MRVCHGGVGIGGVHVALCLVSYLPLLLIAQQQRVTLSYLPDQPLFTSSTHIHSTPYLSLSLSHSLSLSLSHSLSLSLSLSLQPAPLSETVDRTLEQEDFMMPPHKAFEPSPSVSPSSSPAESSDSSEGESDEEEEEVLPASARGQLFSL